MSTHQDFKTGRRKVQSQNSSKRSDNKIDAGLYLIATPIGNIRDISLRALDILGDIDILLCEDTRRTGRLLAHYGIKQNLIAYHDHNEAKKLDMVMDMIIQGKSVGLVSDAGTPLVNDPGYKLVRACIKNNIKITALPGASAPLTALIASGLPPDKFMFAGFLPPKSSARQAILNELKPIKSTLIFFETANRLQKSMQDIASVMNERQIVIARELTKKFEEILRGTAKELLKIINNNPPKGEIVLLISPPEKQNKWDEERIKKELLPLLKSKGVKQASAIIAGQSGYKKNEIYKIALDLKK